MRLHVRVCVCMCRFEVLCAGSLCAFVVLLFCGAGVLCCDVLCWAGGVYLYCFVLNRVALRRLLCCCCFFCA